MVLPRPLVTADYANSITLETIDCKIESLKDSGLIKGHQVIPTKHPLSLLNSTEDQLTILDDNFQFLNFDSVSSLLDFMEACPGYTDKREAEMVYKANVLKFYQNHHLAVELCETGNTYLEMAPTISDNLYGKVLMFIRSSLRCDDNEEKWEEEDRIVKQRVNRLSLFLMSDEMKDEEIDRLYDGIFAQGLVADYEVGKSEGIHQKHPLSHHFQSADFSAQVTIMTDDFDLLVAPSALRLYGTIKLLLNGRSKEFAFKFLDPKCPIEHKDIDNSSEDWRSRNTEFAFKVNLLRYLQNPKLIALLKDTGTKHLYCYTDPKWNIVTARILMILRHIFIGHGIDLYNTGISFQ